MAAIGARLPPLAALALVTLTLIVPALGTGALAASTEAATRAGRAPVTSGLQVRVDERRLRLSRTVLPAGRVRLQVVDLGARPHQLQLQRVGSYEVIGAPQLAAGDSWTGVVNLSAGVYRLWCARADAARAGMRATLRVIGTGPDHGARA